MEYNQDFGAGVYDHGDVTFLNYVSAWNLKGLYWKTYRRGAGSGPLCDGCSFYQTPEGPGGDGLVEFRNTSFFNAGIRVNHHCNVNDLTTGALCASHYLFSGALPPSYIASEADGQTSVLATWSGMTRYLHGPNGANVAFDASMCSHEVYGAQTWVACPDSYQLRTVKIYSPDRGNFSVTADGVTVLVPFRNRGLDEGPTSYGGSVVLPRCSGSPPTDCMNYMWPGEAIAEC